MLEHAALSKIKGQPLRHESIGHFHSGFAHRSLRFAAIPRANLRQSAIERNATKVFNATYGNSAGQLYVCRWKRASNGKIMYVLLIPTFRRRLFESPRSSHRFAHLMPLYRSSTEV